MSIEFFPSKAVRELTDAQFINMGQRISGAMLHPEHGVLKEDLAGSVLANVITKETVDLGARMHVERISAFTKEKRRLDKLRDDYVRAIRKGIAAIEKDVDPTLPLARRNAASRLRQLLEKRPKNFEDLTRGENTTELNFFLADCETPVAQSDLQTTDLLRYFAPLNEAHAEFVKLVADQEEAEARAAVASPAENPKNLPPKKQIKESLATHVQLALGLAGLLASEGMGRYAALEERFSSILQEFGMVAKIRESLEEKKERKTAKEGATLTS
jgi:hypothetical protein